MNLRLWQVDCFLVDRVYQRVADALARWWTADESAAVAFVGFAVMQTANAIVMGLWWLAVVVGLVNVPGVMWAIEAAKERRPPGVMPIARIILPELRLSVVVFSVATIPVFAWDGSYYLAASWVFLPASMYLRACRDNPPPPPKTVPVVQLEPA